MILSCSKNYSKNRKFVTEGNLHGCYKKARAKELQNKDIFGAILSINNNFGV